MAIPQAQSRYRAATMQLVAYLDEQRVEMHIVMETGETIAVTCVKDSIFRVQQSIERMARECPEIATWGNEAPHGRIEVLDVAPQAAATNKRSRRPHGPSALAFMSGALLALALLASEPAAAAPLAQTERFQFELWAQNHCPADTVVWVTARSQVYSSSKDMWYGRTTDGSYVCKIDAQKAGYRAKPPL